MSNGGGGESIKGGGGGKDVEKRTEEGVGDGAGAGNW